MSYPKATILDVETTGLYNSDRAIEIALVQFSFDPTSFEITSVDRAYLGLSDPGFPIPYQASNVHGITDHLVAGKSFNYRTINQIISESDYLIAHNASFDRKMLSKDSNINLPAQDRWRCSCHNIGWKKRHHFPNKKLDTIRSMLALSNENSHQAMADVEVVLEVLFRPALLAELMDMIVDGDINHAVPPSTRITLPNRATVLSTTFSEKATKKKTVKKNQSHKADRDRRRFEYNRPDKIKKAVTDLRGYLRKQTRNADFHRKKAFLDFLAHTLGLDWDPNWNAIDEYESRLQLFVELQGIRNIEEGIYTKKFEEIYNRHHSSKPVQSNSSGKPQKEEDSPVGCMLLIGLLIIIAFAISK